MRYAVRQTEAGYEDLAIRVVESGQGELLLSAKRAPAELQPFIFALLAHLGPGGFHGPLL